MARHAALRVTIKEGKTQEALKLLEDMVNRYPNQLSLPEFHTVLAEVKTLHGILLADSEMWKEARPFLEKASPPEGWRNLHRYYLGQCYYELGEFRTARVTLAEALDLGLPESWASRAHYMPV